MKFFVAIVFLLLFVSCNERNEAPVNVSTYDSLAIDQPGNQPYIYPDSLDDEVKLDSPGRMVKPEDTLLRK
jgi:hypothetical protein